MGEMLWLSVVTERRRIFRRPHHLARNEQQKDFQIRLKRFFDHHLMGKSEPKWMSDGVRQVKKEAASE